MIIRSRLALVLGVAVALAIPLALYAIGRTPQGASDSTLSMIAIGELALGPIGIVAVGWAAGLRGSRAWLALTALAVPILAIVWLAALESGVRSYPG